MLRIHVDFNSRNEDGTMFFINTDVYSELLGVLYPGLRVILYEPGDFQVEAIVHLRKNVEIEDQWYGLPAWETVQDLVPEDKIE